MSSTLKYLTAYSPAIKTQIQQMLDKNELGAFLLKKYPTPHNINNDKSLRGYTIDIKNSSLKKSEPLSKIKYDDKIHIINNALGLHSYVYRVQGNKLKSKNEIRIATIFMQSPEPFLNMIVVHELAHLKEKEHNYS
ncbi:MAG: putative metal-dependent hydrolase [Alteromonadaceae bacterium]|jgi:predicted metal-dependent hydrolase